MRQGSGKTDQQVHEHGTVADAIAAVLKREGVEEAAEMLSRLAGVHVRSAKNKAPAKGE